MEHDINQTRYDLGKIIAIGWGQYRKLFLSILPIILIIYIPINIWLSFVPMNTLVEEHGFRGFRMYMKVVQLTEFLVGVVATLSLAKLVESSLAGEPITWRAALRHAISRWGASIKTGLLGGVIVLGLCLLLIVPGLIWSLYYSMVIFVVSLRGLSGKRALDYSKGIVKGQWWRVFGYLCAIEILSAIACFAIVIPFLFTPENRLFDILSDTVVDVVYALNLTITTVFFLNNDSVRVQRELPDLTNSEPVCCPDKVERRVHRRV